jgi:hypothetical protein
LNLATHAHTNTFSPSLPLRSRHHPRPHSEPWNSSSSPSSTNDSLFSKTYTDRGIKYDHGHHDDHDIHLNQSTLKLLSVSSIQASDTDTFEQERERERHKEDPSDIHQCSYGSRLRVDVSASWYTGVPVEEPLFTRDRRGHVFTFQQMENQPC